MKSGGFSNPAGVSLRAGPMEQFLDSGAFIEEFTTHHTMAFTYTGQSNSGATREDYEHLGAESRLPRL